MSRLPGNFAPADMQVHHYPERIPSFNKAVVTIGTFDGVHSGHRQIITMLRQEALSIGGETLLITFHPHPRKVVPGTKADFGLLTTIEERMTLLEKAGIDHVVIVPFTDAFSRMSAEAYVAEFLVQTFRPHTLIIGYDHRFGQGRSGDYRLLEAMAPNHGFIVKEIPQKVLDDLTVSSTAIRQALRRGDIQKANHLLGYPFFFYGTVTQGDQRGRTLGFPTANLLPADSEKIQAADGVYAVRATLPSGQEWGGMMNTGWRPTFSGNQHLTEVHLFDFEGDLYGQRLKVEMIGHIRAEQKFASPAELKEQLNFDRQIALGLLQS